MTAISQHQAVSETVESLIAGLTFIADFAPEWDDPDELARLLDDLRRVKADAAECYAQVEQALVTCMGSKDRVVPGLGPIEVKRHVSYREWQHEQVWRHVVARARDERRVDESTGEYEPVEQAISRVLFACCRPEWRVTALRGLGLEPDEFCQVERGKYSIKLPPRQAA